MIRRGKDPGKGKFSIPGGFVDGDESVEAAMARELREEVSLEMISAEYLCSHPNLYQYRGVTLPVVDLIFVCEVRSLEPLTSSEEVDGFSFVPPDAIDLEEIAFPSIRYALELFRRRRA